jgi:hypothetical protein
VSLILYGLACVILAAGSPARRVGDSAEYVAMADQLSRIEPPALAPGDIARLESRFRALGTGYETGQLQFPMLEAGGRQDLPHFWLYSAVVVPAYWLVRAAGIHPSISFAAANIAMLLGAFWVVRRRTGVVPAVLLFLGPIVWWIDKPHTEVFTFSLLAAAMAVLDRHPGWSFVLIGVAATQNPVIAFALPIVAGAAMAVDRSRVRSRLFWVSLASATAIAAIHPIYYLSRLGTLTPQALTRGAVWHVPSRPELGAFIWDPNVGLLAGFPLLAPTIIVVVVMTGRRLGRRMLTPAVIAAPCLVIVFVAGFAQTTNFNAGATFGMGRYALWLIPLTIPVFERWHAAGEPGAVGLAAVVSVSVVISLAVAHPRHPDHFNGGPGYAARFLWARAPRLDNPLAEVFSERLRQGEPGLVPVATASCSKVLLVDGVAPTECPVDGVPAWCREPGALCYANRSGGDSYRFASVPQGQPGP